MQNSSWIPLRGLAPTISCCKSRRVYLFTNGEATRGPWAKKRVHLLYKRRMLYHVRGLLQRVYLGERSDEVRYSAASGDKRRVLWRIRRCAGDRPRSGAPQCGGD